MPRLLERWNAILAAASGEPRALVIVGGGAGGVELAMAMKSKLRERGSITLVHQGDTLLPTHNRKARSLLSAALERHQVAVVTGQAVTAVRADRVVLADGRELRAHDTFWVTQASAPSWFRENGLEVCDDGFLLVRDTLQSLSHDFVFGAGDCATVKAASRPKSGVFAVRAARPLVENLRRFFAREPLRRWRPQRQFLSLIGTADGQAVASRGRWAASGAWAWRWKDAIDRKFMRQFAELPAMETDARARRGTEGTDQPDRTRSRVRAPPCPNRSTGHHPTMDRSLPSWPSGRAQPDALSRLCSENRERRAGQSAGAAARVSGHR